MIWHNFLWDFSACFMVIHLHLSLFQCVRGFALYALNMNHCICLHALACKLSFQCVLGVILPWYNSDFCWRSHLMLGLGRSSVTIHFFLAYFMLHAIHASIFWLPSMHVLDLFWHVLGLFWVALTICFMFCIVVVQMPMLASSFGYHSMLHLCCVHDLASFNMTF